MQPRLVFDIETAPTPDQLDAIPEPDVKHGNTKDPNRIATKEACARTAQLTKAALDPHFSRVLAIGMTVRKAPGEEPKSKVLIAGRTAPPDYEETVVLAAFWEIVAKYDRYATFYGSGFDIPFLMRRSLLLRVAPRLIDIGKYTTINPESEHLDVFRLLQQWEPGNGQSNPLQIKHDLSFYAKTICGLECPYDVDKSKLGELHAAGDFETITQLVAWDAATTLALVERVSGHYV